MQEFVINAMNNYGYIGIMALIALENVFPPIPSEVILTFGGFMTTKTDLSLTLVILFSTLGALIGALILYAIGRLIDIKYILRLIDGKLGKVLMLKSSDIINAHAWFVNRGRMTIFLCRFIPLVRSLISIPAGIARMNLVQFILLTAAGTFIWNTALIFAGRFVGNSWASFVNKFDSATYIVFFIFAAVVLFFAVKFFKKRVKEKNDGEI